MTGFWCSSCGLPCDWSNGNETASPPKCRLHPNAAVYRNSPQGIRIRSGLGNQHDPLAVPHLSNQPDNHEGVTP